MIGIVRGNGEKHERRRGIGDEGMRRRVREEERRVRIWVTIVIGILGK